MSCSTQGSSPRVDGLFFDVDDTLFSTSKFAELARLNSIQAMIQHGLAVSQTVAYRELQEVIGEFGSNYGRHYDKLLVRLPSEASRDINPAILVAAAISAYHKTKYESLHPFKEVPEVLSRLAGRTSLLLGIITAGLEIKQADKLVRLGVLPYIASNAIFITDQIGISKPNPKLFRKVCSIVDLAPDRCIYVGDNPSHDIDPAHEIGMYTILCRRGGRHCREEGRIQPHHVIHDMWELLAMLRDCYGIDV